MKGCFILLCALLFVPKVYSQTITPSGQASFCAGASVVLTAPAGTMYQWYRNNVMTDSTAATYTVTIAGNYTVAYTFGGKRDTTPAVVVTANPKPVPSFSFTPNSTVCANSTFTFTANGGAAAYSWSFAGSSTPAVSGNPATVVFDQATGTADASLPVLLTETNAFGCDSSVTQQVKVHQIPDDSITSPNSTITQFNGQSVFSECAGTTSYTFQFLNESKTFSSNTQYVVDWGDGSAKVPYTNSSWGYNSAISHPYTTGAYTLKLTTTNTDGCTNTRQFGVFIGTDPAGGINNPGNTNICTGDSLIFPITNTGKNPYGTLYTVFVTDNSGVIYSTKTFQNPPPASDTEVFNMSSCGITDQFGDVNSFTIKMVITNPCSQINMEPSISTVSPVRVSTKPKPAFLFSPQDTVCINTAVTFVNEGPTLTGLNGTGTCLVGVWKISPSTGWDPAGGALGNDNNSNDPSAWNPLGTDQASINLTSPGTYNVTLKEGSNSGCGVDSITKTICVNPTPTANFVFATTTGCAPLQTGVTTTTNTPNCGVYTYSWTTSYTPTPGCMAGGGSVTYLKGTNSTSRQPVFQFNDVGIYTITLVVTAPGGGCTAPPVQQQVTVTGPPNISSLGLPTSVCQQQPFSPSALLNCYVDNNTTYSWVFPNGTPSKSSMAVPTVSIGRAGSVPISLTASNGCGPSTLVQQLTVDSVPSIAIGGSTNPTTCGSQDGTIIIKGATAGNYNVYYSVNGGSSTPYPNNPATAAAGIITLTGLGQGSYADIYIDSVSGSCNSDTIGPVILKDPNPPAAPGAKSNSPVCSGNTVLFTETPDVAGSTYTWYGPAFPPGGSTVPSFQASTGLAGDYYVTVTDAHGCTSSQSKPVFVQIDSTPAMPAITSTSPVCSGGSFTLTGSSYGYPVKYKWAPLPTGSTQAAPSLTVPAVLGNSGPYTLTVTNVVTSPAANSCPSATATIQITVNQTPSIAKYDSTNPTQCGSPDGTITLAGLAANTTYTVFYNYGTNPQQSVTIPSDNNGNLTITSLAAGKYFTIFVQDAFTSCTSDTIGPVILKDPNPPAAPGAKSNSPVCSGNTVLLTETPDVAGSTYTWYGPAFPPGGSTVPSFQASTGLAGNYYVIETDVHGCNSNQSKPVFVQIDSTPAMPAITSTSPVCSGGSFTLTGSSYGFPVTYRWGPLPTGSTQAGPSLTVPAVLGNSGHYTLTVTNVVTSPAADNCPSATATIQITVNQTPSIAKYDSTNPTQCGSADGTITLAGLAANTTYTVFYNYGTNPQQSVTIPSDNNGNVTITSLAAGKYFTIFVQDALTSCTSDTVGPVILKDPNPPAPPVATINSPVCEGSVVNLKASPVVAGNYVYSWSGPCITSSSQNPSFTATRACAGTYYVTITASSCVSLPDSVVLVVDTLPGTAAITGNSTVCSGSSLSLAATNNTSVSPNGYTYTWTGPALFTSTQQTITITNIGFSQAGEYCATAYNAGCPSSDTACRTVVVDSTPAITSSFTEPTSCGINTGAILLSGLTPVTAYTLQYSYNGHAASAPIVSNPSGNYNISSLGDGIYSNILVISPQGCPSNVVGPDTLKSLAALQLTVASTSPVCVGSPLSFTASVAPTTATVSYTWNGPGITNAMANLQDPEIPVTTIADSGLYTVAATINGCTVTDSINAVIDHRAGGGFTAKNTTVCTGANYDTIHLTGYSGSVVRWQDSTSGARAWNNIISKLPFVIYNNLNETTWYRAVVGNGACPTVYSDTTVIEVVNKVSQAVTGPDQTLCNLQSANISANPPLIGTGTWAQLASGAPPATGVPSNEANTTVNGLQGGYTYIFEWTITGPAGCGGSAAQVQIVNRPTVTQANAGPEQDICNFTTVTSVTLQGNTDARTFEQGLWTIISQPNNGSGTFGQATDPNTTFTFSQPGTYKLQWMISDVDSACRPTDSVMILQVSNPPVAAFSVAPRQLCTGDSVAVTNGSANANVFNWYWGDGLTSTFVAGSHIYTTPSSPGTYTITLVAEQLYPHAVCVDSLQQSVTVLNKIPAVINVTPGNACVPYNLQVNAVGASGASLIEWRIYDRADNPGIFYTTSDTASHMYNFAGADSVVLVVHNPNTCLDSATYQFNVFNVPVTSFTPQSLTTCDHDTSIIFQASTIYAGTDPVNYKWFVNGVLSGNTNPFNYNFETPLANTAPMEYTIKLLAQNTGSCGDSSLPASITVNPLPPAGIRVSPSIIQQEPDYTFIFEDTTANNAFKMDEWNMGDPSMQTRSGQEVTYRYSDSGSFFVKLTATDFTTGCANTDTVTVTVLYVPGYLQVPDAICPGCAKAELRQFLPLGKGLSYYHLRIFTVWGKLVFETTALNADGSPQEAWNGQVGGQPADQATYRWQIEARFVNGTEWQGMLYPQNSGRIKSGFLTIIK